MVGTNTATALVTGANSGIGLETARGLTRAGYRVLLLCRDEGRARAAKADIDASVPGSVTEVVLCDLGDQASIRAAAALLQRRLDRLEVLVNNAGLTVRGGERQVTADGHELMLAVNHLGPFLLTNLLLPLLEAGAPSRIVNVASHAHRWGRLRLDDLEATRGYGFMAFPRYGETKLMNILFSDELARRLEGTGVTVNCVHPGGVATNIGAPGPVVKRITRLLLRSPAQGAATSLYVATAPELAGTTGGYFANRKQVDGKRSAQARDATLARALWDRSAELVGLSAAP
jgi:NAD(P)-dependent dehydrogenase (short-subunit alcohol dehydrogenase family)